MTVFINPSTRQIFTKWIADEDLTIKSAELKKWEQKGWFAAITVAGLAWQQIIQGYTYLYYKERLKLEKKLFG